MKIIIVTIFLIAFSLSSADSAERIVTNANAKDYPKLVIGSKVPDLKDVTWYTSVPPSKHSIFIVFLQGESSSTKTLLEEVENSRSKFHETISFVLLVKDPLQAEVLSQLYSDKFYVGADTTGNIFDAFGIKYIPFSMYIDSRGRLLWQGGLTQVDQSTFNK